MSEYKEIKRLTRALFDTIDNKCEDVTIICAAVTILLKNCIEATIKSGIINEGMEEDYIRSVLDIVTPDGYMSSSTVVKNNTFIL